MSPRTWQVIRWPETWTALTPSMRVTSGGSSSKVASTVTAERRRISSRVPSSTSFPLRRIASLSDRASTSASMCEERKTVCPLFLASRTQCRKTSYISRSRPTVGSSITSRSARVMRAAMMPIFCRLPFEYVRTFLLGSNRNRSASSSR